MTHLIWALLLSESDELNIVEWRSQSADSVMGTAGTTWGRTRRTGRKNGTKRSVLVEDDGGPLAVVVAGANIDDGKLLERTMDAVVEERPRPDEVAVQHLCLDKGYDHPADRAAAASGGHVPHIRRIGEEKQDYRGRNGRRKARRLTVERTIGWLSRSRGILVRYAKAGEWLWPWWWPAAWNVVEGWAADLKSLVGRVGPHFPRRGLRARAAGYCRGLLGRVERKNGWQVAEHLGGPNPFGVQRLLGRASWDAELALASLAPVPGGGRPRTGPAPPARPKGGRCG